MHLAFQREHEMAENGHFLGLFALLRSFRYAFCVSDPRYVPRDFLVEPRDFGRRPFPDWKWIEDDWSFARKAQLDASQSQHQICYGVRELYMQKPRMTKITDLAAELEIEYNRLQKMLGGLVVMQMVDLARLRLLVGPRLDYWMMRGENAEYIRAVERDLNRQKERQAQAKAWAESQAERAAAP